MKYNIEARHFMTGFLRYSEYSHGGLNSGLWLRGLMCCIYQSAPRRAPSCLLPVITGAGLLLACIFSQWDLSSSWLVECCGGCFRPSAALFEGAVWLRNAELGLLFEGPHKRERRREMGGKGVGLSQQDWPLDKSGSCDSISQSNSDGRLKKAMKKRYIYTARWRRIHECPKLKQFNMGIIFFSLFFISNW